MIEACFSVFSLKTQFSTVQIDEKSFETISALKGLKSPEGSSEAIRTKTGGQIERERAKGRGRDKNRDEAERQVQEAERRKLQQNKGRRQQYKNQSLQDCSFQCSVSSEQLDRISGIFSHPLPRKTRPTPSRRRSECEKAMIAKKKKKKRNTECFRTINANSSRPKFRDKLKFRKSNPLGLNHP